MSNRKDTKMKVYPKVGQETVWTPTGAGATVETLVNVTNALGSNPAGVAQVPVRLSTSNEITKSGQARTVIKLEGRLNAQLYWGSTGTTARNSVGANADLPVSVHIVASAPRGAIQSGENDWGTNEGGLRGLFAFLLRTLVTIVTNRSADQIPGQLEGDWNANMLLDALKGKTAYDPVSGSFGLASQG
jgi:hypothetical protein